MMNKILDNAFAVFFLFAVSFVLLLLVFFIPACLVLGLCLDIARMLFVPILVALIIFVLVKYIL